MATLDGTAKREMAAAKSNGRSGPVAILIAGMRNHELHSGDACEMARGSKRPNKKPLAQPSTKLANMTKRSYD